MNSKEQQRRKEKSAHVNLGHRGLGRIDSTGAAIQQRYLVTNFWRVKVNSRRRDTRVCNLENRPVLAQV